MRGEDNMAQVKIYGLKSHLEANRTAISNAIHQSLMEAFRLPEEKRFQRFFPMAEEDFVYPADRSERYTIIEISVFDGRSNEAKKTLIQLLFLYLNQIGIETQDVEITIFETPKVNWGIRGKPGDELQLNYKVEV